MGRGAKEETDEAAGQEHGTGGGARTGALGGARARDVRRTRIIRPPSSVSVAMPAQRLPATPPASNIEAIAPALAADMPTREVKKVGSQSMRQYRAEEEGWVEQEGGGRVGRSGSESGSGSGSG